MLAQRRNNLTTHFSERILVVKRSLSVINGRIPPRLHISSFYDYSLSTENNFPVQIGALCLKDMLNLYKISLYFICASSNLLVYAWRGTSSAPQFPEIGSVTTPLPSGALSCHQKIWAARDISPWPPNPLFLAPYLSLCITDHTTANLNDSSPRLFLSRTLKLNTGILLLQQPNKFSSNFCNQNFALASRKSVVTEFTTCFIPLNITKIFEKWSIFCLTLWFFFEGSQVLLVCPSGKSST